MLNYLLYELRKRRGTMIGWGIGIGAYVALYSLFYPALPEEYRNSGVGDSTLYQALGQFELASFEAYFGSTILSFMAILLAIFAITNGTGSIAGEEGDGLLENQVALPLARWQVLFVKALALALVALVILGMTALAAMAAFAAISSQLETNLSPLDMVLPVLNGWTITMVFLMGSLFLSAYLPTRRSAAAVATIFFVLSFFGNNLFPLVESLEPVQRLLPHYYYGAGPSIFTEGIDPGNMLVLLGISLVFLVLAVLSFERRDITVQAGPWQRWLRVGG